MQEASSIQHERVPLNTSPIPWRDRIVGNEGSPIRRAADFRETLNFIYLPLKSVIVMSLLSGRSLVQHEVSLERVQGPFITGR
ncbi:hypothetical protein EV688_1044 [Chromatocurvus halotolerans]|uniref:Uncharacterized protein n=1 Tax=Chromatocurvus halotolerans TaxID=1132028 RepID=A0A4V2SBR6_9GAMM|nr:hypothetical protein EV688_1044 [Chromatocurvus halotolerans]